MTENSQKALKKRQGFESKQQESVISLLLTSELFQHRFGQFFRKYGVNQAQFDLLCILKRAGEPIPSLEIAKQMITVVPAITSSINCLERKGLVARKRAKADRRVYLVSLTTSGKKLLAKMAKPNLELHDELVGHLTKKQCQQLIALLEIARSSLG